MSLTKKHFSKIAKILSKEIQLLRNAKDKNQNVQEKNIIKGRLLTLNLITEDFINYFKSENPNFDEARFKEAVLK